MRAGALAAAGLAAACLLSVPLVADGDGGADDAHVVVAFAAEPTQIDPTRTSAGVDQYFMALFYEQLLATNPDLKQQNWLAESWRLFERDGVWLVGDEGVQAHPIGTGPWKFVSRRLREEIVVERFDDYWKPDSLPSIRRLTIKIIPEDTTPRSSPTPSIRNARVSCCVRPATAAAST